MKINKQLFEDVLSGKLKGTFVLRNGDKVKSRKLSIDINADTYPIVLKGSCYTYQGEFNLIRNSHLDIVNFIPEINMKENELTIEIPKGKIVDWEESKKQNKIVLKNKQLTYNDVCKKLFKNEYFYIGATGTIYSSSVFDSHSRHYCANNATTEHQLKCILAKNKLATVAKYLNDGWKPSKTDFGYFNAWVLFATPNKDFIGYKKIDNCTENSNVLFKSKELAVQAIEILGEETIELALEPLGL